MWGKHCPWNSTYSIAAILTITQTNIWILITPFLTQVSSLKKKLILYHGLQTSLVYIFSFFRQRKGAHPMFIRHKLSSLVASCKMEKTSIILITSEELAKGLFRLTSPPKGHDTRSGNQTSLEGSIFLFPFNTNNFRTFA